MNKSIAVPKKEVRTPDVIAAVLSGVLPGLGQLYKGHLGAGLSWMLLGMPLAVFAGILLGLATAGVGLILPLVCWVGLVVDAYYEVDLRRHHRLPEPTIYNDVD